jgi:hypothetical protein
MIIESSMISTLIGKLRELKEDENFILNNLTDSETEEVLWILYHHYIYNFVVETKTLFNLEKYNDRISKVEVINNNYLYKFLNLKKYIPQTKNIIKVSINDMHFGANFGSDFKGENGKWQLTRKSMKDKMYIVGTFKNNLHSGIFYIEIEPYTWKLLSEVNIIRMGDKDVVIYEDPRCFIYKGELYISCSFLIDKIAKVKLGVCKFDKEFKFVNEYIPPFGNNISDNNSAWEKNWVFFEFEERLFCVYIPSPFTVLEFNPNTFQVINITSDNYYQRVPINKSYLCNTPPIFVNGKFWFFTHGPYEYSIYAMSFEKSENGFKACKLAIDESYKKKEDVFHYTCNAVWDEIREQFILVGGWADRYPCIYTLSLKDIISNRGLITL